MPTFSGSPAEDLVEFQTKFIEALVDNKIPRSKQVEKLLEVLRGKAKAQIPDKTETMERA